MHKAYDALDRYRCLNILMGYGMVPRSIHILQRYWERLIMVAKARVYYGNPFIGYQGVTQGGSLSPTIFVVVVVTVIHCFITVVTTEEAGPSCFGGGGGGAEDGDVFLFQQQPTRLYVDNVSTGGI